MRRESIVTVNRLRLLGGGVLGLAVGLVLGLAPAVRAEVLFNEISAGAQHTCGVKANLQLACWGDNSFGQANPPAGQLASISAGGYHTCALRANPNDPGDPDVGTAACWGDNASGQATPPSGKFGAISAGYTHTCGVRQDFTAACWGDNTFGQATPPDGVQFRFVSAGGFHTCGVQSSPTGNPVICWGDNTYGQASPPPGNFINVSAGRIHTCGVKGDDSLICWGNNSSGQATPPPGEPFPLSLSAGGFHTCAVRISQGNRIDCWGDNVFGQASPPSAGPFGDVSAGGFHTCALTNGGRVVCWGDNASGQSTPPGDPPPLINVIVQGCSPCRAGDDVRISLDFSNPGPEASVEVLAVSHFPDGATVERFLDEDLKVSLPPGESILDLSPITLPAGLPTGTYFVEAALLDRVTGRTLSRHSLAVQLVP